MTWMSLGSNAISDIGPLSSLTGLTFLVLHSNSINDIDALSELTSLTELWLHNNSITDISALVGLANLVTLKLGSNPITEISNVIDLTDLTEIHVDNVSGLTDIRPLLDNTGIGAGDWVDLINTPANCAQVATLEARGVRVDSGCQ